MIRSGVGQGRAGRARLLRLVVFDALLLSASAAASTSTEVWNPVIAGPELLSGVGLQPPGQMFLRLYTFSEVAYAQYGDAWSLGALPLAQRLAAINPNVEFAAGILPWMECGVFASEASWWQTAGGNEGATFGNGVGDANPYCKFRLHAPQQGGLPLWLTEMVFVSLPTSQWLGSIGTPAIPGGFAPLGRLPATHFGEPEITELLLFRKAFRPFRLSGGLYYSYALPGGSSGGGDYYGDIFQYRLAFEHVFDERRGLAYAIEGIGLHGLPFRLDGNPVDAGRPSFGLLGVQPTFEFRLGARFVGEAGVLLTAAGMNDVVAVYPNFSIYYFWSSTGQIAGR